MPIFTVCASDSEYFRQGARPQIQQDIRVKLSPPREAVALRVIINTMEEHGLPLPTGCGVEINWYDWHDQLLVESTIKRKLGDVTEGVDTECLLMLVATLRAAMAVYRAPEALGIVMHPWFNRPSALALPTLSVIPAAVAIDQRLVAQGHELINAYMEEEVFQFQEVDLDVDHPRSWGRLDIIRRTRVTMNSVDVDSEDMLVTRVLPVDHYVAGYILLESLPSPTRRRSDLYLLSLVAYPPVMVVIDSVVRYAAPVLCKTWAWLEDGTFSHFGRYLSNSFTLHRYSTGRLAMKRNMTVFQNSLIMHCVFFPCHCAGNLFYTILLEGTAAQSEASDLFRGIEGCLDKLVDARRPTLKRSYETATHIITVKHVPHPYPMTQVHLANDKLGEKIIQISFESSKRSQIPQEEGQEGLELVPSTYFTSLFSIATDEDCPPLQVLEQTLATEFWLSLGEALDDRAVQLSTLFNWLQSSLSDWYGKAARNDTVAQIEYADGLIAIICLLDYKQEDELVEMPLQRYLEFVVSISRLPWPTLSWPLFEHLLDHVQLITPEGGLRPADQDLFISVFTYIPDPFAPCFYYILRSMDCWGRTPEVEQSLMGILVRPERRPLLWSVWPTVDPDGSALMASGEQYLWVSYSSLVWTGMPIGADDRYDILWTITNQEIHHVNVYSSGGSVTIYVYCLDEFEDDVWEFSGEAKIHIQAHDESAVVEGLRKWITDVRLCSFDDATEVEGPVVFEKLSNMLPLDSVVEAMPQDSIDDEDASMHSQSPSQPRARPYSPQWVNLPPSTPPRQTVTTSPQGPQVNIVSPSPRNRRTYKRVKSANIRLDQTEEEEEEDFPMDPTGQSWIRPPSRQVPAGGGRETPPSPTPRDDHSSSDGSALGTAPRRRQ